MTGPKFCKVNKGKDKADTHKKKKKKKRKTQNKDTTSDDSSGILKIKSSEKSNTSLDDSIFSSSSNYDDSSPEKVDTNKKKRKRKKEVKNVSLDTSSEFDSSFAGNVNNKRGRGRPRKENLNNLHTSNEEKIGSCCDVIVVLSDVECKSSDKNKEFSPILDKIKVENFEDDTVDNIDQKMHKKTTDSVNSVPPIAESTKMFNNIGEVSNVVSLTEYQTQLTPNSIKFDSNISEDYFEQRKRKFDQGNGSSSNGDLTNVSQIKEKYRKKIKDKDGDTSAAHETQGNQLTIENKDHRSSENQVLNIGEQPDMTFRENVTYIPIDFNKDFHGILLLTQYQMVAVKGFMTLSVLFGEVDITGYKMSADQKIISDVDMYSVTSSSLFHIKDTTENACSQEHREKLLADLVTILKSTEDDIKYLFNGTEQIYGCVLVKKLYSLLPPMLKKLNKFKGFPAEPQFLPQPFEMGVLQTDHWNELLQNIQNDMAENVECKGSMMLCGAGNVGKSSLARFSINRLLGKHQEVFCLDCDCGQSEFTPPSVLSLVKITKPLLGLPFSHQLTPVSSYFFGHISPGETPSEYIKLIGYLYQTYCDAYCNVGPLIINTCGWVQGLGLSLLIDCIRLTSPCHVVYITGHNEKSNVLKQLNHKIVENENGWSIDSAHETIKKGQDCKYYNLTTTDVQKSFKPGNKSRIAREQCITSYFSKLFEPYLEDSMKSGNCYEWIPPSLSLIGSYVVRWEDVALHVMHENVTPDVMLFGFNLALVGLACVEPDIIAPKKEASDYPNFLLNQPVAEHIGFGIIRNIDEKKKLFYILTPEPVERLRKVNALLRGGAQLPTSYYLEDIQSDQPYFCSDYITVASKTAGGMKPRYNLKRKPSKMRCNND